MNEHCAAPLGAPTRSSKHAGPKTEVAVAARRFERRHVNGLFFLGTVFVAQLSWFGALAYLGFRLLY
jgi:hypothetical protein